MKPKTPIFNIRDDIDAPLWDLSQFSGRLKHFFWVTDFRTCILPTRRLEEAKELVSLCRSGQCPDDVTDSELRYAKKLYESAYHPDSGELQNVIGRMSFQVPGGVMITAGMLQFYRSNAAVVGWQFMNQSFNALVNYTNRNAASELTNREIGLAYITATTSALVVALGAKRFFAKRSSTLLQRFVPWIAVASANMVNIPFTRQSELRNGIICEDENGKPVVQSQYAAMKAISQVTIARISIATPGMLAIPIMVERLQKTSPYFLKNTALHLPFQTAMLGIFLTFMVPIGCALFPQRSSIETREMGQWQHDVGRYAVLLNEYKGHPPQTLYFNKGL